MQNIDDPSKNPSDAAEPGAAIERMAKLRALRGSMKGGKAPARSRDEVERILRSHLTEEIEPAADPVEADNETPSEPMVEETVEAAPVSQAVEEPIATFEDQPEPAATQAAEDFVEEAYLDTEPEVQPEDEPEKTPFDAASVIAQLKSQVSAEKSQAEEVDEEQFVEEAPDLQTSNFLAEKVASAVSHEAPPATETDEIEASEAVDADPLEDFIPETPESDAFVEDEYEEEEIEAPSPEEISELEDEFSQTFEASEDVSPPSPQTIAVPDQFQTDGPIAAPGSEEAPDIAELLASAKRKSSGRANKTRMLGFDTQEATADPFAVTGTAVATGSSVKFPVGWLVVTDGPGRGETFALTGGAAQIGRDEDQGIRLDFGDTSISRQNHAAIAYDETENQFLLGQGGKANLVRLNGRPVLSNEKLGHGDEMRIGTTTLKFIAVCDESFSWAANDDRGNS